MSPLWSVTRVICNEKWTTAVARTAETTFCQTGLFACVSSACWWGLILEPTVVTSTASTISGNWWKMSHRQLSNSRYSWMVRSQISKLLWQRPPHLIKRRCNRSSWSSLFAFCILEALLKIFAHFCSIGQLGKVSGSPGYSIIFRARCVLCHLRHCFMVQIRQTLNSTFCCGFTASKQGTKNAESTASKQGTKNAAFIILRPMGLMLNTIELKMRRIQYSACQITYAFWIKAFCVDVGCVKNELLVSQVRWMFMSKRGRGKFCSFTQFMVSWCNAYLAQVQSFNSQWAGPCTHGLCNQLDTFERIWVHAEKFPWGRA